VLLNVKIRRLVDFESVAFTRYLVDILDIQRLRD
jgi:hypothetical protein